MIYRASLMLAVIAYLPVLGQAADEPAPTTDFIEFLGEWQTTDGQWVDPNTLDDVDQTTTDDVTEMVPEVEQSDE